MRASGQMSNVCVRFVETTCDDDDDGATASHSYRRREEGELSWESGVGLSSDIRVWGGGGFSPSRCGVAVDNGSERGLDETRFTPPLPCRTGVRGRISVLPSPPLPFVSYSPPSSPSSSASVIAIRRFWAEEHDKQFERNEELHCRRLRWFFPLAQH